MHEVSILKILREINPKIGKLISGLSNHNLQKWLQGC
jgi:hypothetical protein